MSTQLNPQALEDLIRRFTSHEHVVPLGEYEVGGKPSPEDSIMLQPRLERAAVNQITGGDATLSRYSIWAETLRSIVLAAAEQAEDGSDAKTNLIRAANSLGAFALIQRQCSSM